MSRDNNSISSKMYSAGAYSTVSCLFFKFLLNKFLDMSTPSMRKGRDEEKKMEKMENNGENSGHLALTLP